MAKNSIRIFIASPGDVSEERRIAFRVVERLRQEFLERADLQSVVWEHEPLLATADFQSQIGTPAESDIFVLLMWSRLGSPLSADFVRTDGSRYASATEYEFEEAVSAWRTQGRPRILAYRKTAPMVLDDDQARSQYAAVEDFFSRWFLNSADQTAKGAFHEFSQSAPFEDTLEIHLRKSLRHYLPNPSNLPASVNSYIERPDLTRTVTELLAAGDSRLITLAGPGGAGKTRLSLSLGASLLPNYEDGVFFVPLAAITDPRLVPSTIAMTLGIKDADEPVAAAVIRVLRRKRLLLLIDNLEQVQAAGKYLSELLSACADLHIVVTSREALRLSGAITVRVPPLALPDPDRLPALDELRRYEAIALFVSRAKVSNSEFDITEDNAHDVVEICRRVDALPLAIELAASRLRTMKVARLSQAMAQRFKVLTGGADDLLDHQKNLRALIMWSYELLDSSEQALWRRLAVFPDGCTLDAAQAVCDPKDEYFVEVDIEALVDKSLVTLRQNPASPVPRVSMLESLREFAHEQLLQSEECRGIQQRFCAWCLELGFIDEESTMGAGFTTHLMRLDQERGNLRAALDLCIAAGDTPTALLLCGQLYQYWSIRGLLNEGIRKIEQVLAMDSSPLSATVGLTPINMAAYKAAEGRALKGLSTLLRQENRLDEAERYATKALAIYRGLNDGRMSANVLCELGAIAQRRRDLDKASDCMTECIELARAEQMSDQNLSFYLIVKGITEHLRGDLALAKAAYIEGLEIAENTGDKTRMANALMNLGEIIEAEDQPEQACICYRDSLALWGELHHTAAIAACAEIIAGIEVRFHNCPSEAAFLFGAADAARDLIDVPPDPSMLDKLEADRRSARLAMSTTEFDAAWHAGRELGVEGILRHVLGNQYRLSTRPSLIAEAGGHKK